jgi:hypothetical protein
MMPIATTRHLKDAWSRVWRLISLSIQIVRLSLAIGLAYFVVESCFALTFFHLVRDRQAWTFHLERGMLAIQRLEGWRHPQPRHYGELITIRKPLEKLAPWNWAWSASAPSWWGDVGYDVRRRGRLLGFEFASGIFWPPFVTQHPKVPFTIFSFPLWLAVPLLGYRPTRSLIRGVSRYRDYRRSGLTIFQSLDQTFETPAGSVPLSAPLLVASEGGVHDGKL